jgi:hypothetical protein
MVMNYIIREQQEIIRLLREQNEALQREVVLLERGSAQWNSKSSRLWKARVDLAATCGYDFTVSQLVYAIKHADGFVGSENLYNGLQDSILMTLYPFFCGIS